MTTYACPTCPATVTGVSITAAGHVCPGRAHRRKDEQISTFRPLTTTNA